MRHARNCLPIVALALGTLVLPGVTHANLVSPACDVEPVVVLGASELIELVLSTVIQKGVAVLLLGSTAVVSLPWLVAAVGVAVVYIPRWLKA